MYFRGGFGPFRFSQRLGRTQGQKRAAAKAKAQRRQWRSTVSLNGVVTARTPGRAEVQITGRDSSDGPIQMIGQTVTIPCKDPAVTEGQGVHLVYRRGDSKLRGVTVDPAIAAQEAERLTAKADHDARTYRAVITECHIDGVKGGGFTIEADGRPSVGITVEPDTALRFLSLKNGDIVQVTLGPDNSGLEEFWHLCRANGAKPRSPASFGPGELRSRQRDESIFPEG